MLQLYKNIKKYRLLRDLSQEQLAVLVGYKDRTSIAKIESGKVDLSISKISEFAKVFSLTEIELMGLTSENKQVIPSIKEQQLLSSFRQLNNEGQDKVIAYADDLSSSGKYIKSDFSELVEEA